MTLTLLVITLFGSITMLCGIDNIPQNIPHTRSKCGKYYVEYRRVPHNKVMDMNNVMVLGLPTVYKQCCEVMISLQLIVQLKIANK
jgi:hypothetical protein